MAPFQLLRVADLPEEWRREMSVREHAIMAAEMGIPPSDLRSTVCFEAPDEPSAWQYQNWLHDHASQSGFSRGEHVNVALVSTEAFFRSRGAEGLARYRISMSAIGRPNHFIRIGWSASAQIPAAETAGETR